MNNDEIVTRINEIKRRAKSQHREQCVTIILTPDGFVKMFDAGGTVKRPLSDKSPHEAINEFGTSVEVVEHV